VEPEPRIRVLIVDDHEVVRRGLLAFLGSEPDLELVGDVEGGAQALEALERLDAEGRRPHVVLMDLKMEPLDGVETTRRILAGHDVRGGSKGLRDRQIRRQIQHGRDSIFKDLKPRPCVSSACLNGLSIPIT